MVSSENELPPCANAALRVRAMLNTSHAALPAGSASAMGMQPDEITAPLIPRIEPLRIKKCLKSKRLALVLGRPTP